MIDRTLSEFTAQLASAQPAPGGGGAAALTGALAASLTAAWGAEAVQALGEAIDDLRFGEALTRLNRQMSGPSA